MLELPAGEGAANAATKPSEAQRATQMEPTVLLQWVVNRAFRGELWETDRSVAWPESRLTAIPKGDINVR